MGFKPYNKNRTHGQLGLSPFSLTLMLVSHATLLCLIDYLTEIQVDFIKAYQALSISAHLVTDWVRLLQLQTAKNILWVWNTHQSWQKSYYKLSGHKDSQIAWSLSTGSLGLSWLPGHSFGDSDCNLWRQPDGICEAMVLCDLELSLPHTSTHLCFGSWMGRCYLGLTFVLAMLFYIDSMPIRKTEKKPDLAQRCRLVILDLAGSLAIWS